MSGITMRDIGRQLGVSAVTVSKALAGKSGVSEEMRQKIIRRASELGYVNPNAPQTTPTSGLDVGILRGVVLCNFLEAARAGSDGVMSFRHHGAGHA